MSIDLGRVIQNYQSCLTILKAKQNLTVQNYELNALFQGSTINNMQSKNICVQFIEDGLLKIVRAWCAKFNLYQSLKNLHSHNVSNLEMKMIALKSNTDFVTRQDQLMAQIQAMLAKWRHNMTPVQYYNNKFRRGIKSELLDKLQNLKISASKTHAGSAPLYSRRILNQFKQNLRSTYYDQIKVDGVIVDKTMQVHDHIITVIQELDNQIEHAHSSLQITPRIHIFFRDSHQIISRTAKPSDRKIRAYEDSLNDVVKKNYQFWSTLRKSLQSLIELIHQIQKGFIRVKANFEQKQQIIDKLLADVPSSMTKLFRVDVIYNLIKSFNSSYGASVIVVSLREKMMKRKQFAMKNQEQCSTYANKITEMSSKRFENFHHFALLDKKHLQDQSKSQRIIIKLILQSFRDLLEESYKITKDTRKLFIDHCKVRQIGENELSYLLSMLIVGNVQNLASDSTAPRIKSQTERKSTAKQNISKIEQLINSIEIFQSETVAEDEKYYSCALGPKLLLHGKLYVLPDGLFFQSQFNKQNLFFGKTKLFIPKSEILEIDMKNTLLVFPDAVAIKTEHGLVSFHALGHRRVISAAIREAYFDDAALDREGDLKLCNQAEFMAMDPSNKTSQEKKAKLTKPFQVLIYENTLKGSQIAQVFRKYFGDDKFQLRGKQYQTFKSYCLTLIDAKSPKSTKLSPAHPIYFNYKNQAPPENAYPESSTRTHSYKKDLPKIPFLSKGGEGDCEQRQVYHWLGADCFVIDVVSTVKGFSLTEGMQILIKLVLRQVAEGVKVVVTSEVKFAKESSSNGLVKNPTFSNIKQSMGKTFAAVQNCERSRKQTGSPIEPGKPAQAQIQQPLAESSQPLNSGQIQLSKQQLVYSGIALVIFYLITIVIVKAI